MTDIAVVITCFNLGRTIDEALDSVAAQTRQPSEVVVVDDESTDLYTRQRVAALTGRRLRVARIEHRGEAGARNRGVALTSAPYVLFLDADDALDPRHLERTAGFLDGAPAIDFVSTAMQGFGEANYVWTPPPPDLETAFTRGTIPVTSLLRRHVWDAVQGFDERLAISPDLDFWIRVFARGFRGHIIDEPLFRRRVRSDSLHHAAVSRGTHREVLGAILRKHRDTIERIGPSLLVAKDAFIEEQRADQAALQQRQAQLRDELGHLNHGIAELQGRLRAHGEPVVDFADFRRTEPVSPMWGFDRGNAVDRYYIERFLASHRSDIKGRVLEIKDPHYSYQYGSDQTTVRDVLDIVSDNPSATIVADLAHADSIPADTFDCFILTQTLHIIYDIRGALFHAHRILKPGGVLLATLPAVSRINYEDGGIDHGDYWRFTEASLNRLFGELFPPASFEVNTGGNLRACIAFLYGLAAEELLTAELDHCDRRVPLIFCVRAVKPFPAADSMASGHGAASVAVRRPASAAVLMYHRIAERDVDPHRLCVSLADFRAHMQYLAAHYRIVPLEDLVRSVDEGHVLDGAVAVTFDDGMLDSLEMASPILSELAIPATFFVNTDRLLEEHEPWWDVLARIFLSDAAVPHSLVITLEGRPQVFPMASPAERSFSHDTIHRWLLRATLPERDAVMAHLVDWSGAPLVVRNEYRVLVAEEIRRLAARPGHTIGCHSVHHLLLPAQSREVQAHEIGESRRQLEQLLGRRVTLFSYPYGGHDADTVDLVRGAGFAGAVTTHSSLVCDGVSAYALPRFAVEPGEVTAFVRALPATLPRRDTSV